MWRRILPLFSLVVAASGSITAQSKIDLSNARPMRDAKQPVDTAYTAKILRIHDGEVLPLAARRLPAGVEERPDAEP